MTTRPAPTHPATPVPAGVPARYHAFDALRAAAMLLGLWLHASVPYLFFAKDFWAVYEEPPSTPLLIPFVAIHAFRMQLFFVMAGFFARLLVEKRGVRDFLRNRGVRVGVPLGAGLVILSPALVALWVVGWIVTGRPEMESDRGFCYPTFHLWFLEYLLWMYGATVLLRMVWQRVGNTGGGRLGGMLGGTLGGMLGGMFRALLGSPVRAFALAVPTFGLLWLIPGWESGPTRGCLGPEWASLAYYTLFFWFGWALHAQRDALPSLGRWWTVELVAGLLVMLPVLLILSEGQRRSGQSLPLGLDIAGHGAASVLTCLLVFGVMGLFVRHMHRPSAAWRYASDASYWLYLTHLPVQIGAGLLMLAVELPPLVEFGLLLTTTTVMLLAVYHVGVRRTFIGRVLNGPRIRGGDATTTAEPVGERGDPLDSD